MKSKKARSIIRKGDFTYIGYNGCRYRDERAIEKSAALEAIKIAEQEIEEHIQAKAHKIILDMMTGIFHGDMPRKIADEFIQKLTEDEVD
ncbi:hypothetical protein [uncultured Alistipes sp.]|uniref:hypothetical protein n=1 Tax=uncultured Alistipes sp. TaxID=538949 RepID=UPI002676206E|nr:hypothetical protein [uncultured Alistipes sp.]